MTSVQRHGRQSPGVAHLPLGQFLVQHVVYIHQFNGYLIAVQRPVSVLGSKDVDGSIQFLALYVGFRAVLHVYPEHA